MKLHHTGGPATLEPRPGRPMRPDSLGPGRHPRRPCPACPGRDRFQETPDLNPAAALGNLPNLSNLLGGSSSGAGSPSPAGTPAIGGGSPGGGGSPAGAAQSGSPAAGAGGVEQPGSGGGGAAARAVDLAQKFQGQPSKSLKGKLPGFNAPGGNTNNCAAFVSACLEHTGALPKGGGSASVSSLRGKLKQAGWKKVPGNQAPKGSVWMTAEGKGSHTELVAAPGGKQTIGSNNVRKGFQTISQRSKNPSSGEFYAPPNG